MRTTSVAQIKGICSHQVNYPRPGSVAAEVYDLLMAHKGRVINIKQLFQGRYNSQALGSARAQLADFYGCDIRSAKGVGNYILAGEWFEKKYVDYVIQAIDNAVSPKTNRLIPFAGAD